MKFNINILYWIAMVGLVLYYAYTKGWILANFQTIPVTQLYTMIESDKNVTLLDVRTEGEYNYGHIKGAKLIPLDQLKDNLSKLSKDKKIVVYCQSGNRSVSASRLLEKNGYIPINVKGGYLAWRRERLDKK